jgi:hypothetical protein
MVALPGKAERSGGLLKAGIPGALFEIEGQKKTAGFETGCFF